MKNLEDYLYYEEKNPSIKIYLGDCLEIMPLLPKVDLVVTDPPYGIGAGTGIGKVTMGKDFRNEAQWDDSPPPKSTFDLILSQSKEAIIWGGNYFELPPSKCFFVWDKVQPEKFSLAMAEQAWSNIDSPAKIWRWKSMGINDGYPKYHPTQKPIQLIKWCITQCKYYDIPLTILDPFLGSGTTLVACKELKRNGIGIEINEKYCEIAKKRLKNTIVPML